MSGMTKRKIVFGTATLALCGTLALGMTNEAPLILYPITPSLPPGFYVRTFEPPTVGMIAAFRVPEAAKHYKASIGEDVHDDFLIMKPIVAGPGDQVCSRIEEGLFISGKRIAPTSLRDRSKRKLPNWRGCRQLLEDELFTLSTYLPNSFDSRHYGPISVDDIRGIYSASSSSE